MVNPNLEGLDFDSVWQDYWGKFGEYLVWEGWVAKYPDQIELHVVPATEEIEIKTEESPDFVNTKIKYDERTLESLGNIEVENQNQTIMEKINSDCMEEAEGKSLHENNTSVDLTTNCAAENGTVANKSDTLDTQTALPAKLNDDVDEHKPEVKKGEYSLKEQSLETKIDTARKDPELMNNKATLDDEREFMNDGLEKNAYDSYMTSLSPLKYVPPSFEQISGANILNTLQNRIEGFGTETNRTIILEESDNQSDADNLANERAEMVQMMHNYSGFSPHQNEERNVNEEANLFSVDNVSCTQEHNYDQMWADLWNEHYTETYWYYYNQFAEKFNKLSPKHELPNEQIGEVVFESEVLIIPGETHCSCNAVTEIDSKNADSETVKSQESCQSDLDDSYPDDDNVVSAATSKVDSCGMPETLITKQPEGVTDIEHNSESVPIAEGSSEHISSTSNISDKICGISGCSSTDTINIENTVTSYECNMKNSIKEITKEHIIHNSDSKMENMGYNQSESFKDSILVGTNLIELEQTERTKKESYKIANENDFTAVDINLSVQYETVIIKRKANKTSKDKDNINDRDSVSEENSEDIGPEPVDGSRKKRKKKERQERIIKAQSSGSGNSGKF